MAETTIEWTATPRKDGTMAPGYTFNPWIGCTKISAGCAHCYAEKQNDHRQWAPEGWGVGKARKRTGEAYWKQPLQWNKIASAEGVRRKVFCASLADVFDAEIDEKWRDELWGLIAQTPHLDWLLLTKRPENIGDMIPWADGTPRNSWKADVSMWPNVWLGTSVENQAAADARIPELLKIPASVRFLSCEPLLGAVDLHLLKTTPKKYPSGETVLNYDRWEYRQCEFCGGDECCGCDFTGEQQIGPGIHWVIAGGESGPNARPMHPDWARGLRDQCVAAGVAFHFKQHGEWLAFEQEAQAPFWLDQTGESHDGHGLNVLDPETGEIGRGWHPDSLDFENRCAWKKAGKKAAGRLLDGREWNELPAVAL